MGKFNKGNVVTIMSGGVKMTVLGELEGLVICSWYDTKEAKYITNYFLPGMLKLEEEQELEGENKTNKMLGFPEHKNEWGHDGEMPF